MARVRGAAARCRELAAYGACGLGATLVNTAAYWALSGVPGMGGAPANALAWLAALLFAFAANRAFVFGGARGRGAAREAARFLAARASTGALDMALMWLLAGAGGMPGVRAKAAVNAAVIAANYLAGKFWVFKKAEKI